MYPTFPFGPTIKWVTETAPNVESAAHWYSSTSDTSNAIVLYSSRCTVPHHDSRIERVGVDNPETPEVVPSDASRTTLALMLHGLVLWRLRRGAASAERLAAA
jgi:hypothetical protein